MALREVDAISNAIIATEKEIADGAWGQEEDDDQGEGEQDRSLEDMGDGLEGQHEPEEDEDADGEDADGDEDSEGDAEAETAEAEAAAAAAKAAATTGKGKDGEVIAPVREPEGGRVPSGKLREATERARAAETERDALKAQIEKSNGENKSLADKFDLVMREINDLKRGPRADVKPPDPPKAEVIPDIFEDPKGFAEHLTRGFQTELSKRDTQLANQRVETSMAIAHAFHKDTFEKAFDAINKLNVQDPSDRATVQRIYNSPNPGEALVGWHKRNETFARVGDDPAKFEETIRAQTREALMKNPEFRKALIADLRRDAAQGDNGNPRTTTRLPGSLHRAGGSNLGADRGDMHAHDDSEQGVADAAWR